MSRFEEREFVEGISHNLLVLVRDDDPHGVLAAVTELQLGENLPEPGDPGHQLQSGPCGGELRSSVDLHIMELLHGSAETSD